MDQAGEMILFDVEGREVTMHVQIAYDGPSENFGWILPIPTDHPDEPVAVGTESVFQALLRTTQPIVQLNQRQEGQCLAEPWECYLFQDDMDGAEAGGDPAPAPDGGGGEVEVLLQAQVGPFDVSVLAANEIEVLPVVLKFRADAPSHRVPRPVPGGAQRTGQPIEVRHRGAQGRGDSVGLRAGGAAPGIAPGHQDAGAAAPLHPQAGGPRGAGRR